MADAIRIDEELFALAATVAAHTLGMSDRGGYPEGIPYEDALRVAVVKAYRALLDARDEIQLPPD
jgi:hypothetical protein